MRILFLEQFSELGGGQRCLLDLLPAIRDRGWEALVAAPGAGPLFDRARDVGAGVARIELGGYKTAAEVARFAIDTVRLSRWIARQRVDMIWSSAPRPLIAAALGASGHPVIFHAQHFLRKRYALSAIGWALRHARARVIADSHYVAAQYRGRVDVVYNGVPEIPFTPRHTSQRIGIIGRIAPMKGQTDFLRAARALAPKLPGAKFVICGAPMFSSNDYMREVEQLAQGLPVEFLGWREDIGAVLADLDLLVVPSNAAEATTRVIMEAFSAGVPVVAYSIGGIPEVIENGVNGFLVPEREPGALAQKIADVVTRDLAPIAARARADWEQRYTVERYREQMIAVMSECLPTASESARGHDTLRATS